MVGSSLKATARQTVRCFISSLNNTATRRKRIMTQPPHRHPILRPSRLSFARLCIYKTTFTPLTIRFPSRRVFIYILINIIVFVFITNDMVMETYLPYSGTHKCVPYDTCYPCLVFTDYVWNVRLSRHIFRFLIFRSFFVRKGFSVFIAVYGVRSKMKLNTSVRT